MTKKQIEGRWKSLETSLIPYTDTPQEVVSYIKELYSLYDSRCLAWLGGLFDADIGGFYYSNSARDGDEFFPDIESTGQALGLLENAGLIKSYDDIPEWMRSRIACFITSCEDSESGYFYNPQWSRAETDAQLPRRSRDSRWAIELAEMCNFQIPYPSVFTKIKSNAYSPEYLKNEENFIKWLNSMDWKNDPYKSMSNLASQNGEVIDSGLGEAAIRYIENLRDPYTGLWAGELGTVKMVKTVRAAASIYNSAHQPIKDSEKLAEFIISSFDVDYNEDITFCAGRWTALGLIVNLLIDYGGKGGVRSARNIIQKIIDNSSRIIPITVDMLSEFKKADGSFSYTRKYSSSTSQSMRVAKEKSEEGDVNATLLATSVLSKLLSSIAPSQEQIPIFSSEDMKLFEDSVIR